MKKFIKTILLVSLFTLCIGQVNAQPGFDDDVEDVPLDGGISLLVIGTVGYGLTKLKKNLPNK